MRVLERRVYEGPNLYALYPVVRLTLALGPMEENPSDRVPGFTDGLLGHVPTLWEHGCCFREHGGFVRRLREGTWMGHILEHVAIALLNLSGHRVSFGKTRGTGTHGEYHVVYAAPEPEAALLAGETAQRVLESLIPIALTRQWGVDPASIDAAAEIHRFVERAARLRLDRSTQAIVDAAVRRGIPWRRLGSGSFVQLGNGCRQRRLRGTVPDASGAIAVDAARKPELARRILGDAGVPVDGAEGERHRLLIVGGAMIAAARPSFGGAFVDVTDGVHPDNAHLAVRAAALLALDVADVELISADISRSWSAVGGSVAAVCPEPDLEPHLGAPEGPTKDIGGAFVDMLFAGAEAATVPVLAVTGTNGKTTTARMVAHLYASRGMRVGLTTTEGVYVGGRLVKDGDMTGPRAARMVLDDSSVEVAVLEVARGGILRAGMGTPWCDVGAVTNVTNDHLGMDGVRNLDDLAFVKSVVVESARRAAVLNADDLRVLAMGARTRAERVCLVSARPGSPELTEHIRAGGTAVVIEQGEDGREVIVLHRDENRTPLLVPSEIPATLGGAVRHNVENAMFAAAMAFCGGLDVDAIREGLVTFRMSFESTPGRLNVFDGHPFRVIMDYGHNPAGYRAMGDVADRLDVGGRRICVFGTRATRRDAEILECARVLAEHFDVFVCRGEDGDYGRPLDEVPRMQAAELRRLGIAPSDVHAVPDEVEAVDAALSMARPGDLVVVFAAELERTWQQILAFGGLRRAAAG